MKQSASHTDRTPAAQLPSFREFLQGAGISDDSHGLRPPLASSSAAGPPSSVTPLHSLAGLSIPLVNRRHTFSNPTPAPPPHTHPQNGSRRATTQSPIASFITLDASNMDILNASSTLRTPANSAPASPQSLTCAFCGRIFTRRSTFLTHENTHSHTTAYVCKVPGCGLWYTVAGNAYRHLRTRHGVALGQERSLVAVVPGHAVHPPEHPPSA